MVDVSSTYSALVSGSSGLIGAGLIDALRQRGVEVRRLVRREAQREGEYEWDPYTGYVDDRAMKGIDVVINLSGANIGEGRWTRRRKEVLYNSRIVTTRVLAEHIAAADDAPSVFISQSAIGIYGDRGDQVLTEASSHRGDIDFLAGLTVDWEAAADPAREAGVRVVHPRTGLVLASEAALMQRLVPLFRLGLGGPLGDGEQWWSWVDLSDVVQATMFLIDSEHAGPYNVVSPNPVRQREFARTLASILSRPAVVPAPSLAMKFALGSEKAEGIGLSSTRAIPERLLGAGYEFSQSDLAGALRRIVG